MKRLLWAAIAGLILGAIAFGMLTRDDDASGSRADQNAAAPEDPVASPTPRFEAGRRGIRETGPDGRRIRPNLSSATRGLQSAPATPTRPPTAANRARASNPADADSDSRRADRSPDRAITSGRRAVDRDRQAVLDRLNRLRSQRADRARGRTTLSPEAARLLSERAGVQRRNDPDRIERAYESARRNFEQQLADSEDVAERVERERREGPGDEDSESDDADEQSPEESTEEALQDALRGLDPDDPMSDTLRDAIGNLRNQRSDGRSGPQPIFTNTFGNLGGGRFGGGNDSGGGDPGGGNDGGDGGGDNGGDNGGGSDDASNPIIQPPQPPDGLDPGDGDPGTPPSAPLSVEARWQPVSATPQDGFGFRAADLFLSFENPTAITVLTSAPGAGIQVVGGRFFQETTFGSNVPPESAVLEAVPFAAVDSFLTLGGQTPFFPGSPPDPTNWGQTLNAVWAAIGARTVPDSVSFNEGRHVIWIARLAAGGSNVAVTGAVGVNYVDLVTGRQGFTIVPIQPCESCYAGADGQTPPVELSSFSFAPASVGGGTDAEGLLTLSNPAPAEGAVVTLQTDAEALSLPASVVFPPGSTSTTFTASTRRVTSNVTARITATLDDQTIETTLRIEPLRPLSVVFTPSVVESGATALATVTLNAPAPSGGVNASILLSAGAERVVQAPPSLFFPPGARSAEFQAEALPVAKSTTVRFLVGVAGDGAFGQLTVEGRIGDLIPDGVVGPADLALLLGSWGPCANPENCAADINADGVVGPDDLAALLGEWGDEAAPPDDEPDEGVIARWIAVDNASCSELDNARTADLYIGFTEPSRINVVTSGEQAGISIEDGAFYQHPQGTNRAPAQGLETVFPCIPFDSYLAIEGVSAPSISFTPGGAPDIQDWGATLRAEWFVTAASPGRQDPSLFGDNRFYTRIGRFTAPADASVSGEVQVFFSDGTQGDVGSALVRVIDWSRARGDLDLNADGLVDADDLALLTEAVSSGTGAGRQVAGGPSPDLNADGRVDAADLRALLEALQS